MLIILLVIIFWAVIPGLITGWMLWERGWNFPLAFLLGALGGPVGILLTLALISAGSFKSRHSRAQASRGAHGRAFRVYYDVPVVGRLHVSTVWALAGVATFTCVWMLAGLGYEFYVARRSPEAREAASQLAARTDTKKPGVHVGSAPSAPQSAQKPSDGSPPAASASPSTPLLNSFAGQRRETAQVVAGSVNAPTQSAPPPQFEPKVLTAASSAAPSSTAAAAPPRNSSETSAAPPSPPKASAQGREAAISELTRSLGAAGHRVHAALSGDAQTATLSLSGATLTRPAGNQLLGGRARAALKAAGIRIVVMVNGQESWTYIL
jgi:hypothetical protein